MGRTLLSVLYKWAFPKARNALELNTYDSIGSGCSHFTIGTFYSTSSIYLHNCNIWTNDVIGVLFWLIAVRFFRCKDSWPRGFKCSTQLSTKSQLLIKTKISKKFLALSLSDNIFIMLINVKMPTIVGILTFMAKINFVLSLVEHGKKVL